MRVLLQFLLPVLVLGSAIAIAAKMIANMESPTSIAPPPRIPMVHVLAVSPTSLQMEVKSQGTVEALTAVVVSAQVTGRISTMSDNLRPGSFFAAGETLVSIDDADYRLALVQQDANVARAVLRLAQENAEAEVALRAWQQLEGTRSADSLATRKLFVAEAEAALAAAKATRSRAELDLQRTKVSLPFAGRVRRTSADVGQFLSAGQPLAEVYGIDFVEVRLPIPDDDAAFLDLARTEGGAPMTHAVELTTDFAGQRCRWNGTVVRTEGEIDRRTRQLTLVARIAAPFDTKGDPQRQPLTVGMFVEATIQGRRYDNVYVLPRAALRQDGRALIVDVENRLYARMVNVLRRDRTSVYVYGELAPGERICLSPIDTLVDGMPVQVLQVDPSDRSQGPAAAPKNGGK
jgi:RND family efflux transporter MFP subunit